jgi:hypothetical protein
LHAGPDLYDEIEKSRSPEIHGAILERFESVDTPRQGGFAISAPDPRGGKRRKNAFRIVKEIRRKILEPFFGMVGNS